MKIHIILRDCDTPDMMAAYRAAIIERLRAVYPKADLYIGSHDGDSESGVWVDDPPPEIPYDVRMDIEQTLDAVWCEGAWREECAGMMWGFEVISDDGQWTTEGAGVQDESNMFDSREEAEAEIDSLAEALDCPREHIRVVGWRPATPARR